MRLPTFVFKKERRSADTLKNAKDIHPLRKNIKFNNVKDLT